MQIYLTVYEILANKSFTVTFFIYLGQQFITQGTMAVCAYRRNYV